MDWSGFGTVMFCFIMSGVTAGIAVSSSNSFVIGLNVGVAVFIFGCGIMNCFIALLKSKKQQKREYR